MRAENLPALDLYIQNHIGTVTTRHASEEGFECPAIPDAVDAERAMRATMHVMFDGHVAVETAEEPHDDLDDIKADYWGRAQHADKEHGARPEFLLDDYFHVSQDRSYNSIRTSVVETYGPESVAARMFGAIDAYQTQLGVDTVSSSRLLTSLLSASLPTIKKNAASLTSRGMEPAVASDTALVDFADVTVQSHIADLQERVAGGDNIKALINKSSIYPKSPDQEYTDQPLRISRRTAEGIAKAYRVQERPYTDEELAIGETLMRTPATQHAILLFHTGLVDYAAGYLAKHPERAKHSLEPFSEIFLADPQANGEQLSLIPNPKLIKVIGNNTVPAISRVLLDEGVTIQDLNGDHIQRGIELAKKLRVFQTQIGQFNNYDAATDTVDLTSLFNRTCPAMQMFSEALTKQLPDLYDSSRQLLDNHQ